MRFMCNGSALRTCVCTTCHPARSEDVQRRKRGKVPQDNYSSFKGDRGDGLNSSVSTYWKHIRECLRLILYLIKPFDWEARTSTSMAGKRGDDVKGCIVDVSNSGVMNKVCSRCLSITIVEKDLCWNGVFSYRCLHLNQQVHICSELVFLMNVLHARRLVFYLSSHISAFDSGLLVLLPRAAITVLCLTRSKAHQGDDGRMPRRASCLHVRTINLECQC